MFVFSPDKKDGLTELEDYLIANGIDQSIRTLMKQNLYQVNLQLPKFRTSYCMNLGDILSEMGMPQAFDIKKANFTGIAHTEDLLYLSDVVHKTYVDINEDGCEATATTYTTVQIEGVMIMDQIKKANFIADHPFLFCIRENRNGSILFLGRIVDPRG